MTFSTPVTSGTVLTPIPLSAPVPVDPALRFAGDPLYWIGLPAGTVVNAFATGCVSRCSGTNMGVPGQPALAWTAFQLAPLPQMNFAAYKLINGGLPVQIIIVLGAGPAMPVTDDVLPEGSSLVTAPAGPGSTAFMAFAFQDRLCRDPLSAAEAIAASNACDLNWPAYVTSLAALASARNLHVLDHRGAPFPGLALGVAISGGAVANITSTADGGTGIAVPEFGTATVSTPAMPDSIIAGGDSDVGAFQSPLILPAGKRIIQVLNAADWLQPPDLGVSLPRWHANTHIEPLQDGTRYFTRLVEDMRSAKVSGAVQIAGWAVVRGSFTDSSVDWPLIPGDMSTTILSMINEVHGSGAEVRLLLNQFLQLDSQTLDDFPELIPILFGVVAALGPLQAFAKLPTDPAGYTVAFIAYAALTTILASPLTLNIIKSIAETSKPLKDALDLIDPTIATMTPYPASFPDNPVVAPGPFKILAHTIDDISHIGVYHQKHVTIKPAAGDPIAYLGGIDINNDRPDTPLHRVKKPFHDLQLRITGPAVQSVLMTYAERATVHGGPIAIPPAPVPAPVEARHLVQIARTYYKPTSIPGPFNAFAPNGESTPVRTLKAAIGQAADYIYIEDQYFTPPDDYAMALIDAAAPARGVRSLMITTNFATDQPFGNVRRQQVFAALKAAWGGRLRIGSPLRRFSHETPALNTNLGRLVLTTSLSAGSPPPGPPLPPPPIAGSFVVGMGPPGRLPAPPFWAFIGNELVLVHALDGPATATQQMVQISRNPGSGGWGAQGVAHEVGTPVMAVQVPGIYVHAKMMIVDDIFLFAGSSNVNRRGHYHDGELNSFTIPQHLSGDATNPAKILRSRLMAEHIGLTSEMGQALFADPHSAFHYFSERTWFEQSRWRPLDFFGSLPPDVPIGTSGSLVGFALQILLGSVHDAAKPDVWPLVADPTGNLDPSPTKKGPDFP